jgi:hypothetical protein
MWPSATDGPAATSLDLERILLDTREPVVEPSSELRIEEEGSRKA